MTPETLQKLREVAARTPRDHGKFTHKAKAGTSNGSHVADDKPPECSPTAIDIYFEPSREKFWTRNATGDWMPINKTMCELILRSNFYSQYEKSTNSLTRVEQKLLEVVMNHAVKYAGEMAGWTPGLHIICGHRVLISRGPSIPTPKRGHWRLIRRFIRELLGDEGEYFYAWMRAAFSALQAGPPFAPGQLLALAGPPKCGKSLLQRLITVMLGGRMAKPYSYLMEKTDFNDSMIAAEHLVLDDEVGKANIRTRKEFAAKLKSTLVNQEARAHPKGGKEFMIEPFWRVTMSLNDEPENLLALPPLDSDIDDKILLLRAAKASVPYPSANIPTMQAYWEALKAEVPAYLFALLKWEIPEPLRDIRFGVRAYQNPDLTFALSSLSPESKLWTLILQAGLLENYSRTWQGTASDLEVELQKTSAAKQVENLLYFPTAAGVYLARLAKSQPKNVEKQTVRDNRTIFTLSDPKEPTI